MEDLKNWLMGIIFLSVGYLMLFLTYFIDNENLHNITYTIMWFWVTMVGIGVFFGKQKDKKIESKTKNKALVIFFRALFFGQPLVAIYFGDMWLGVLWLIFIIVLVFNKTDKRDGDGKQYD